MLNYPYLRLGSAFQALDTDLTSIAALGSAADKMLYTTGANTWAEASLTSVGRAILDDANVGAQRTTLGLAIGTDVQAWDASLDSIAALTYASDSFIKVTAEDTYAIRTIAETKTDLSLNNVSNVATDDTAYNATSWNTNSDAATKNAIRDKVETMDTAIGSNTTHRGVSSGNPHSVTPTELSLVIGTNTQAFGAVLDDFNTLGAPASDGQFIVATGAGVFAYESTTTARTSLGVGTGDSPTFAGLGLTADGAAVTLKNSVNEHGEGEAETLIKFTDHTDAILAQIQASHSGTSDDTKGKVIISTHTGSALTEAIKVDENQSVTLGGGVATAQLKLPQSNDAATPTLAFGDGDSGFYESANNQITLSLNGGGRLTLNTTTIGSPNSAEWGIKKETATATNAVFIPSQDDSDTGLGRAAADALSLIAGGVEGLRVTEATTMAVRCSDKLSLSNTAEGNTGQLNHQTSREVHTLAGAGTSDTTTISIPSGAKILGVSFCVNTAVVDDGGNDTWSAAYITGSTATLATAAAAAQNTKIDTMLDSEITSDVCQIRFTANGGNFTSGIIEIVAYYCDLTSLANV